MDTKLIGACIASGLLGVTLARGEEELEELTVVANRLGKRWIDASGSTLQADSEELLKTGAQDLAGFAKYDPTVSLPFDFSSGDGAFAYGQSGYGSINIRGMEGNRIAIELDGIRQAPQYVSTSFDMGSGDGAGGTGRDYFDPAMFEMIEVLKGGASALYGSDALGGVVSFRTPDPEHFLNGANAGGLTRGQYFSVNGSTAFQLGGAVKHGNTSFLLLAADRRGEETENNGNVPPNPSDFDSQSVLFKVDHTAGDHLFRGTVEFFERDTFINAVSAAESDFPLFTDFVHNWQHLERQRVSFRWDYTPAGKWLDALESHVYWQRSESNNSSDSASKPLVIGGFPIPGTSITRQQTIDFTTEIAGFSSIAKKDVTLGDSWGHLLMLGVDVSVEDGENRFDRVNNGMPLDRISFAPSETTRAGIFFQDEVRFTDKWFITPGVRLDWQEIDPNPNAAYLARLAEFSSNPAVPEKFDNLAVSPRLNIAFKPKDNMQWYASYAHGVRNPSAEELSMIFEHPTTGGSSNGTTTVPNPDLKEEKSDAFEIGFKADGEYGRFQAATYYTHYTDFIENGVPTGDPLDANNREIVTTRNVGEAEIYGFEVGGVWELGSVWSEAKGWQIGLTTGKSVGINRTDESWLNTIEPWKTVGFIGYDDPEGRFGARLTGMYVDDVTRVDDTTNQGTYFRPPSWFTLDLGVYWRPEETLTIHAGLNNIFDEKYWMWGSVRRGNGHLGGSSVTERTTAPGRNFSISLTKTF